MRIIDWLIKREIKKEANQFKKENPEMVKFFEGKRTYLTMAVVIILAVINSLNDGGYTHIHVPDIVFSILGALGIYTRAIAKPK